MQGKRGSKPSEQNLAMLGHELCSVLNGIQGMTELLGGTSLNGEQKQFVEAVDLSIRQMQWLIGGIRSQRHGSVFPFSSEPGVLDGPGLLEQAVRCHTRAAMQKDNLLLLLIDPQLPQRWFSDARPLRQIIDNLLGNAIKFTRGGLILIEASRKTTGQGEATGLELQVRDTGMGFDPAASQRIFKPFMQADPDIGRVHGGTGLGLYICRRIVARMKGQLNCHSRPGSGSSFRILLPGVLEPDGSDECAIASGLFSSLTCRVSVEGELGRSVKFLLQRMGIQTEPRLEGTNGQRGADFHVEISLENSCATATSTDRCLLFTPGAHRLNGASLPGIRHLQAPFLTATLGPLLMEMVLEWKLSV